MAEKDKDQLLADLPNYYDDNNTGNITPADNRNQQTDVIDSMMLESDAMAIFTLAAYGGINYLGAPIPIGTLTATYVPILAANNLSVDPPRFISTNFTEGSLAFDYPGVYFIAVTGSMSHDSSNSGRAINLRMINETTGTPGNQEFQVGVGRNVQATTFSATLIAEIDAGEAGDEWVVQVGGGDTLTNVELNAYSYTAHSIGEFRGQLPSDSSTVSLVVRAMQLAAYLRANSIPARARNTEVKSRNIRMQIADILASLLPSGLPQETADAILAWLDSIE